MLIVTFYLEEEQPRTINYDRFIESDKSGQTIIQSAAKNILDKARKRHNEFLIDNPGGDNVNNPR